MNGFNSDVPPPDLYDAEIFDVRDLGILPTSFGPTIKSRKDIRAMNGFNYDLPAPGIYDAQIFEIRDLGIIPTSFGPTHKVAIRFRVGSGNSAYLVSRAYAYKITARSHLGRDIASLLGELPEPGFDLRSLVGLTCQLHVAIAQLSDHRKRVIVLGILPSRKKASWKVEAPFTAKKNERFDLPLGVDF